MIKASSSESQFAVKTDKMNSYGYYVSVDSVFYQIPPYDIQMEFGFNKLGNVPFAPVSNQIKVFVYRPDWVYEKTSFFAQELDIVNHDYTSRIEPQIVKHNEEFFELHFPALKPGQLLIIRDINNLYAISIGSISDRLVELFNTTDAPAHAVLDNIKKSLKSFPENQKLQEAKKVWETRYENDKSSKVWETIRSKYKEYEVREDREGKLMFAKDALHEIEYYLSIEGEKLHDVAVNSLKKELEAFINDVPTAPEKTALDKSQLSPNLTIYKANSFVLTMAQVGDDYLLRFHGIPNEFNGKVIKHSKSIQNEATGAFILKSNEINGENWNTLVYENDGWGGNQTFVYPPLIDEQHFVYLENEFNTDNEIGDTTEKIFNDYANQ